MLIEASLLHRNLLNEGNQIQHFFTVSVRTFVIPFYSGFRLGKKIRFLRFRFRNTTYFVNCYLHNTPPFLSNVLRQENFKWMGKNRCLLGKVIFSTLYDWFVCLEVRYVYFNND
jgi:hypothetical protein